LTLYRMIVALEGILEHIASDSAIIKVGPLSLQVYIPGSTLMKLGGIGDKVYLNTHLHWKEDSVALYGFSSAEDLKLFQYLISVSGIGPRVALSVLSNLNTEQVVSAIVSGNSDLISQVPGIGKKTSARIILELKGKLEKDWKELIVPFAGQSNAEVVEVLTGLGYSLREATQAVSTLQDSKDLVLEEKVRLALKQLASI
jgi:Holliday junction DNA helicase RuvA